MVTPPHLESVVWCGAVCRGAGRRTRSRVPPLPAPPTPPSPGPADQHPCRARMVRPFGHGSARQGYRSTHGRTNRVSAGEKHSLLRCVPSRAQPHGRPPAGLPTREQSPRVARVRSGVRLPRLTHPKTRKMGLFDSPRLHYKDQTDQDGSNRTIEDLKRSAAGVCDDSGMVQDGPPESGPDLEGPNPSVNMSVNGASQPDALLAALIEAWPAVHPQDQQQIVQLVQELADAARSLDIGAPPSPDNQTEGLDREA